MQPCVQKETYMRFNIQRHLGSLVIDSREIAAVFGRNHRDLMRDARDLQYRLNKNSAEDLFLDNPIMYAQYDLEKGSVEPYYLLTDMAAHRLVAPYQTYGSAVDKLEMSQAFFQGDEVRHEDKLTSEPIKYEGA